MPASDTTTTDPRPSHLPARGSYDVIVVGARAAGAAAAHLLARLGVDVLLVDRSAYGADTLSTHALMRGGVMQLARWGLLERVVAAGTPPVHTTTFRYADDTVSVAVKPKHGVDALYAPRRTVLDPILVDAAVAAGAEVRFGLTVDGVVRDPSGAVAGIVGRDPSGARFTSRARLVIGADGIRSTVAGLVDAPFEHVGTGASATIYGHWTGLDTTGYEWNFRPDAASGVIPTNDGAACVFVAATPGRIGRGGAATFHALLRSSQPELADRVATLAPAPVRTFAGRAGYVRRSWGAGWALVGDAGYFKDPLSAHGLTDALRDAELVARAAAAVVGGAVDSDALAAYQRQRDEVSAELFAVVDTIAGHAWSDDEIGGLLLRLNAAMNAELEVIDDLPALPTAPVAAASRPPAAA